MILNLYSALEIINFSFFIHLKCKFSKCIRNHAHQTDTTGKSCNIKVHEIQKENAILKWILHYFLVFFLLLIPLF